MGGTIVAMGGLSWEDEERRLEDYWLGLAGTERPRVLVVPTAVAESAELTLHIYERLSPRAAVSQLSFFPWPPSDFRELALGQDAIYVTGGNTANALAIWRVHGVDVALRKAWERGAVLGGWSAGANCWFEDSVTDSYGPRLRELGGGLGFLAGSFCPHFDGEPERRPTYKRLVRGGVLAPGYAADDDAAFHFEGTELREVVSQRESARGYRVTRGGEEPLEARAL